MLESNNFGLVSVIVILFVTVGIGMAVNVLWNLLTGGPRAKTRPGAPYLYDRQFYLVFLVVLVGWWVALLSFFGMPSEASPGSFMIGWGIMAVGMGSLYLFKGDMMIEGSRYLASHGFTMFRFFYALQDAQLTRQSPFFRKLIGGIFLAAGIGALLFNFQNFRHLPDDVAGGAEQVVMFLTHLAGLTDRS